MENDTRTTKWQKLSPKSEFYLFIPRDEKLLELYEKAPKITDIFPINSVGIVTARDKFVIHTDKSALKRRIKMLCDETLPDELIQRPYKLKDKSNWKLKNVRKSLRKDSDWESSITKILYRPFDIRWIFYHDAMVERSRKNVMRHMLKENLGLLMPKRVETKIPWSHILCSNEIVEHVAVSLKTIDYVFPLYTYPDENHKDLFSHLESAKGGQPNINPKLFSALLKSYNCEFKS